MFKRCLILACVLVIGHFVVDYVEDGYSFGSVVPPANDFSEIPPILGPWRGVDGESDPRLLEFLQARSGIDRTYDDVAAGRQVGVHAVWTDDYIKIHFPEQCYRETGWALTASKSISVTREDGETFPAKLLSFSQEGKTKFVLYWFQLGDDYFFDRWKHRALRRQVCWGKKEWPPLMKFMLESSTPDEASSRAGLEDIAGRLHMAINSPSQSDLDVKTAPVTDQE